MLKLNFKLNYSIIQNKSFWPTFLKNHPSIVLNSIFVFTEPPYNCTILHWFSLLRSRRTVCVGGFQHGRGRHWQPFPHQSYPLTIDCGLEKLGAEVQNRWAQYRVKPHHTATSPFHIRSRPHHFLDRMLFANCPSYLLCTLITPYQVKMGFVLQDIRARHTFIFFANSCESWFLPLSFNTDLQNICTQCTLMSAFAVKTNRHAKFAGNFQYFNCYFKCLRK